MSRWLHAPLALLLLAGAAPAGNLDRALLSRAGQVLEHLNDASCGTAGVLPFRVRVGKHAPTEHSPLSAQLPGRLENALIVVQGGERSAIRVLRSPVGKDGPWRTSRAAFAKLFRQEHEPAWGTGRFKADAFLTGEVSFSAGLKTAQVTIDSVDARSFGTGKLSSRRLASFKVSADLALLRDLGVSLSLASLPRRTEEAALARALEQAALDEKEARPAAGRSPADVAGMRLEVLFDGAVQKIALSSRGVWQAPPVRAGQKVSFRLTRTAAGAGQLGALLRIDGRSTWQEEDDEPALCRKWAFSATTRPQTVLGFYHKKTERRLVVRPFALRPGEARGSWATLDVFAAGKELDQGPHANLTTRSQASARGRTLKDLQARLVRANHLRVTGFASRGSGLRFQTVAFAPLAAVPPAEESNLRSFLGGVTVFIPTAS